MIAATLAFIGGFLLSWPTLVVLVGAGILFEHNGARGAAVFATLVTMAVCYFFFSIPLMTLALGAVAYIIAGLIFSFYRYKRHADDVVEANKGKSSREKEESLRRLHPKMMLKTITAWIVIWPISLIENLVGDIINGIQVLVRKVFRAVYHRIYDSAVAKLQ